ncbi:MAG: hypothetical protein AAF799_06175 [Myxococcota bacterium]
MSGGSKKARQNKDFKVGRIGNRASTVKIPSGEEDAVLEDCFECFTPPGFSTWHEYFTVNRGTPLVERNALLGLCNELGAKPSGSC